MNSESPFYFAGEAAKCLGVTPITLRTWRDRGICDFGFVDPALCDNPRARRRYSDIEVSQMAVALTLSRFGYSVEEAFLVAGSEAVRAAISGALSEEPCADQVFSLVGGCVMIDGKEWSSSIHLSRPIWAKSIPEAWEARDTLFGSPSEFAFSLNISSIARRVARALFEIDGGGSDE